MVINVTFLCCSGTAFLKKQTKRDFKMLLLNWTGVPVKSIFRFVLYLADVLQFFAIIFVSLDLFFMTDFVIFVCLCIFYTFCGCFVS